ncbi:MAG: hypothetical protein ACRDKI_02135 [Solirubrobacterales bacterium]
MIDPQFMSDAEADEMMEDVYAEAGDSMSPTLTPFISLGTNDPAMELMDGPTTPEQAEANDLWGTFKDVA